MSFKLSTPPEWQRSTVSKYCEVQLGKMLQPEPSSDNDELLPYLRAINISKSGVDVSHEFLMWIKPQEKDKYRINPDDVLVSEGGDAGRTAQFSCEGEYYFQNAINRVRPLDNSTLDSRYVYYWFTFLKLCGYVELICNVATIPHFTAEKVKAPPLVFPKVETQKRITAFLDERTDRIDTIVDTLGGRGDARFGTLIALLLEYRGALIAAALTGQMDGLQ